MPSRYRYLALAIALALLAAAFYVGTAIAQETWTEFGNETFRQGYSSDGDSYTSTRNRSGTWQSDVFTDDRGNQTYCTTIRSANGSFATTTCQ